jgi:hypothetical protein
MSWLWVGLSFPRLALSPLLRFLVAERASSSSSSPSSSSPSPPSSFFVEEIPEKSPGPRVSRSPSCYDEVRSNGHLRYKIVDILVDAAEQCFGRLKNNTDIVCADGLVVPLYEIKIAQD